MARQPTAAELAKTAEANAKARTVDPGMEALLARGRAKRTKAPATGQGWVGSGPHSAPQAAPAASAEPSGTVAPVTDAKTTVTPAKPARGPRAR